ncbi:MAG: hypothetical protein ACSHWU_09365 [Marinicella sp.]
MKNQLIIMTWLILGNQTGAKAGAGGEIISVGPLSAGDCDYTLIQEAIDQETFDIHVVTGIYDESISLTDQARNLVGGFADCEAAEDSFRVAGSQSTIQPSAGHAMLVSSTNEGGNDYVSLTGFEIVQGEAVGFIPAGGMTVFGAVDLAIFESRIADNVGQLGGGIFVQEPASFYIKDSMIENNTAYDGGGIYCLGCDMTIDSDTGIHNNQALGQEDNFDGNGGGIYISEQAQVLLFAGSQNATSDHLGIHQNDALKYGGGIYVVESDLFAYGNEFFGFGDNTRPVSLTNNTANYGGGLYAAYNVTVNATAIDVSNNQAVMSGAGMAVEFGAILNIHAEDLFVSETCWNTYKQQCNRMMNNQIPFNETPHRYGGAIKSAVAEISVSNTWFENNGVGGGDGRGAVWFAEGDDIYIQNSVLYKNGDLSGDDRNILDVWHSEFHLTQSTVVDNSVASVLIRANDDFDEEFLVTNSIIHNNDGVPVMNLEGDEEAFLSFNCLLVHEQTSFAGLGSVINVVTADPQFLNRAGGNLNLYSNSLQAIDRCQAAGAPQPNYDLNLTFRQFDVIDMGNDGNDFIFDIGAIEYQGNDDYVDVIFKNSFEPIF